MFQLKHLNIALLAFGSLTINSSYAGTLQAMTDQQLSNTTGQALMSLSYIAPNDAANLETKRVSSSNIGFYKLGLEADVALNANIKKLQLGCGGVNSENGCDIDIDNFSISGASTDTQDTAANRAARVQSDAIMKNPFIEFAIKNPNFAATRSIEGFRLSAESVLGMLTFGTENSQTAEKVGIPNGINSLSGYMEIASASGTANTKSRQMTQSIGNMTGRVNLCGIGGFLCSYQNFTSSNYNVTLDSAGASFTTKPAIVNGTRQTSVSLLGEASIAPITFHCPAGQSTCMTATVLGLNLAEGVNGVIKNLKANVTVEQNLGLIHKIPVNGNAFSLSVQSQAMQWPGAAAANIAQKGWWLAFEGAIDIGNISPSNDVDIPDDTLKAVLPYVNTALYNSPPTCSLIGGTSCFGGNLTVPDIYLGPGGGAPVNTVQKYVPFPLNNQVLSAQSFVPNCYGTMKFC
ncbi:hypothetical protein [uncultured Acinetobacter sp.]|uniref:hypothetical protein n=1 Tax=uncultured Acinetobacter sp. TaxID=165433 RepID=UPI0025FE7220|nr:hypothetical protein [uncultured Acinetobacter sp.]